MKAKSKQASKSVYQTIRKPMPPPSRVTKPSAKVYVRVKRVDSFIFTRLSSNSIDTALSMQIP